jgi:hypothetical protein
MVMLPQELLLANIPFRTLKQLPGNYVITLPEGLHFVINSGSNIAEATNYACEDWVKHRKTFPNCTCSHSKNIKAIAARFKIEVCFSSCCSRRTLDFLPRQVASLCYSFLYVSDFIYFVLEHIWNKKLIQMFLCFNFLFESCFSMFI